MPFPIKIDESQLPRTPALWPDESAQGSESVYVLEQFVVERSSPDSLIELGVNNVLLGKARGWERVFLSSEVTGNPRRIAQLWRVPKPYPGEVVEQLEPGQELPLLRKLQRQYLHVSSFSRVVLEPLPYDPVPAERPTLKGKRSLILVVQVGVKDGAMARLVALKKSFFKPTVEEPLNPQDPDQGGPGWKLVAAGNVAAGSAPASTIVQVWLLPSAGSLPRTMSVVGNLENYRTFVAPLITQESQLIYAVMAV